MGNFAKMNPGIHHVGYKFNLPVSTLKLSQDTEHLINVKFKTAVVINRVVYVGNVEVTDKDGQKFIQSDAMYKSSVAKFDTFTSYRKIEASINDGDEIIKLEEYADRILQFKKNKMHIINVSQELEFLEETFIHKGVSNPNATCKTDYGIAWANKNGCYIFNGKTVTDILEKNGLRVISFLDWDNFISDKLSISYSPKKKQLILVKSYISDTGSNKIYIYDLVTRSWTKGLEKFHSPLDYFSVTAIVSPQAAFGDISGAGSYAAGVDVTLQAIPKTNYEFVRWEDSNGTSVGTNSGYTFQMPSNNVSYTAVFQLQSNFGWELQSAHNHDSGSDAFTFHVNGIWISDRNHVGSTYKVDIANSAEYSDAADENLAHQNINFSPNQYYDVTTDRTYFMCAIDHSIATERGWENCIGYYDHTSHSYSDLYGTGYAWDGNGVGTDQHALGAFIISEDSSNNRYIIVVNPLLDGTGSSNHNQPMIIMRSNIPISSTSSDEIHLQEWDYICTVGCGTGLHGSGVGATNKNIDYPHLHNCSAIGQNESSVLLYVAAHTKSYNGSIGARNCLLGYRSIDAGATWNMYDNWAGDYGVPYGCAGGGKWGGEDEVTDGDNASQLCNGYKIADGWQGTTANEKLTKSYPYSSHGDGNKIGIFYNTGMDSNQGYDQAPYKDIFYISSEDGIHWGNVMGTWEKNVITGNCTTTEDTMSHHDEFHWITLQELGHKDNLMWVCSSRRSALDGVTISSPFSTTYASGPPGNSSNTFESYTPDLLASSSGWKLREDGGHGDYTDTVGNYTPTPSEDDDRTTGIKVVIGGTFSIHTKGGDTVVSFAEISDAWPFGQFENTNTTPNGIDLTNKLTADLCVITFDLEQRKWKIINDGRGAWGRMHIDKNSDSGSASNTQIRGPNFAGQILQEYEDGKFDIWMPTAGERHTFQTASAHSLQVGHYVGNGHDFTDNGTSVGLVTTVTTNTHDIKILENKIGTTSWADGNNIYFSDVFKDANADSLGQTVTSYSEVDYGNGLSAGKTLIKFNTEDFFENITTSVSSTTGTSSTAVFFDTSSGYNSKDFMCPMIASNVSDLGTGTSEEMLILDFIRDQPHGERSKPWSRVFKKVDT